MAFLLCLAVFGLLALISPDYDDFWTSLAVSGLSAVLVWFCICLRPNTGWVSNLLDNSVGDASYSTYLVHNAVVLALLGLMAQVSTLASPRGPSMACW